MMFACLGMDLSDVLPFLLLNSANVKELFVMEGIEAKSLFCSVVPDSSLYVLMLGLEDVSCGY